MNVILDGGSHERRSGQGLVFEGDFDTDWLFKNKESPEVSRKGSKHEAKSEVKKRADGRLLSP